MAANYLGTFPVAPEDSPYPDNPIEWAMAFITAYGQTDGSHHKNWVLDQVARVLRGTPVVVEARRWGPSDEYPEGLEEFQFSTGKPSDQYLAWVEVMLGDTDEYGDRDYDYDVGIAP